MAYISSKLVRLQRRLNAAKARKEYKDAQLQQKIEQGATTAYKGKGKLVTYYVPSITDPEELLIQVSVAKTSLTEILGGFDQTSLDKIGGFLIRPDGKAYAQQKGFANQYMSIKVVHRKATPAAKLTPWGTRVIDVTDSVAGQKSRQLPIGGDDIRLIYLNWKNLKSDRKAALTPCDLYLLGTDNSIIERVRL